MLTTILIILGIILAIVVIFTFACYRIVDPSEAHLVITPTNKFVVSADDGIATNKKRTYFAIPSWVPFIGRAIRIMDVTIKEAIVEQETYEKSQARYYVRSSLKYRIASVSTAAETFVDVADLENQLKEVIQASVRAVTVKYDVVDARAMKNKMQDEIKNEMDKNLSQWGLELVNFQLVDFQDTKNSSIISDISKRREAEIQSTTRQQVAVKQKEARMQEAESDELARKREIEKEKVIGEQEQLKAQKISEMQKDAMTKQYDVTQVSVIRTAEIEKQRAIVAAEQSLATETINKDKKIMEGQGDRLRLEEQAKGNAAKILQDGLAEAQAKDALQKALNLFGDNAIRALVAEKVVAKDQAIGVETAKALSQADVKVFSGGGDSGKSGFDLGKMITSMSVADPTTADAMLNKIARPNDMGLTALGLKSMTEMAKGNVDSSKGKPELDLVKQIKKA
jgi:flotillin